MALQILIPDALPALILGPIEEVALVQSLAIDRGHGTAGLIMQNSAAGGTELVAFGKDTASALAQTDCVYLLAIGAQGIEAATKHWLDAERLGTTEAVTLDEIQQIADALRTAKGHSAKLTVSQ